MKCETNQSEHKCQIFQSDIESVVEGLPGRTYHKNNYIQNSYVQV